MYFDVAMVIILVKPAMLVCQQHHQQLALVYKKNTLGSTISLSKTIPILNLLIYGNNIPNDWLQPLMFLAYLSMLTYHIIQHSSTYLSIRGNFNSKWAS